MSALWCVVCFASAAAPVYGCSQPGRGLGAVDAGSADGGTDGSIALVDGGGPRDAVAAGDGASSFNDVNFDTDAWEPTGLEPTGSTCKTYVAKVPAKAVPALKWVACGTKSKCRHLQGAGRPWRLAVVSNYESIAQRNGHSALEIGVTRFGEDERPALGFTSVFNLQTGLALAAVGTQYDRNATCTALVTAGAAGAAAVQLSVTPEGGIPTYHSGALGGYALATTPKSSWHRLNFNTPGGAIPHAYVNNTVFFGTSSPTTITHDVVSGKAAALGAAPDAGEITSLGMPIPARNGVFLYGFNAGGYPGAIMYAEGSGLLQRITPLSGTREYRGMALDRGRNDDMVWLEQGAGDERGRPPVEVWTSPFAMVAADLKSRKVAKEAVFVRDHEGITAHKGLVLFVTSPTSARVIRLADGKGWTLSPEPGTEFRGTAGLTDDEAIIFTGLDPKDPVSYDLHAFRLDALGEPTVPSGI